MSFTCPRCGMTSHHPRDEQEGYCGNCHEFTGTVRSYVYEIGGQAAVERLQEILVERLRRGDWQDRTPDELIAEALTRLRYERANRN